MKALLRICVRLFPAAFRHQFGEDMSAQAVGDYEQARRLGPAAAMRAGLASAGNLLLSAAAERVRPTWIDASRPVSKGLTVRNRLQNWRLDFVYATRALRRTPGFAAVAVLTLALAIGVTAGMFAVVNTVLIDPLPYGQPDRLLFIGGTAPGSDLPPEIGVSSEFWVHYRERSALIQDAAVFSTFTNTVRAGDRVERLRLCAGTFNVISTLGGTPVLGRLPTADDEDRVAVISYALWQTWFGGRRNVIGETYSMAGSNHTIVGVMGPEFRFPNDQTVAWLPYVIHPNNIQPGRFGLAMIARMKPGATPEQVASELTSLSKELPGRFGGSANYARVIGQYRARVRSLSDQMLGQAARPLWVLFGAAAIVLAIACANVANLFLVRAEGRQREMAVRQAIGAGRVELLRVQMAEVLLVSLAAGALAVVLARVTLPAFIALAPTGVLRLGDAHVDAPTIAFTAVVALLAGLACGLAPAFRASSPRFDRLRDGSRGATRGRRWGRDALVAAQTALALLLLIGSALLLRSHSNLSRVSPGYSTENIFTFQIAPEQPSLVDGPSFARFSLAFMDRMRALPGVQSVGLIENVPLDEGTSTARFKTDATANQPGALISYTFAGADYYQTMGIKVLEGRGFTREDATTTLGNAVLSRSAARMLFPDGRAVGQRIQREGLATWETVVGVVDDVMQDDFRTPAQALVYLPMTGQEPRQWVLSSPGYVVKTSRADTIEPEIRAIVKDIAPEAPMYRVYTMAGLADRSMAPLSFTMLTLGMVSVLALVLGAVGLYGVLSYVVAERTREIGVRMALGAQAGGVRRMVVAQGLQVVVAGVAVGVAGALLCTRALGALLFGVNALDLTTFVATSAAMVVIGVAASYVPARRASNVDPIVSLRGE